MSGSTQSSEIMLFQSPAKRFRRMEEEDDEGRRDGTNPALKAMPEDVIHNIFSFLPIKDAVQTGTVSPKFRRSWQFCRHLNFDTEFARGKARPDYMSIVDRVFALHSGSKIHTLRLCFIPIEVESVVENWIRQAIQKEVEELELNFLQDKTRYKLPSEFLDVPSLKVLKLCCCEIDLSPDVQGLRLLQTVVLRKIQLKLKMIDTVFKTCNLLESFDVAECYGAAGRLKVFADNLKRFKVLKVGNCKDLSEIQIINAPYLHTVFYQGKFIPIKFENTPWLNNIMLNFSKPRGLTRYPQISTLANDLSRVLTLTVSSPFVEELSSSMVYGLQFAFPYLKELQLIMEGTRYCNVYDIACLLDKCPSLERLFIDFNGCYFDCGRYWKLHQNHMINKFMSNLNSLKLVKLNGFRFLEHEAELGKFLMERARFIEILLLITPQNSRVKINIPDAIHCHSLFMHWKSPRTKIVVLEHLHDTNWLCPSQPKIWYDSLNLV
ncbi:hypothetical protein SLA2020_194290 [Shorea laevis]